MVSSTWAISRLSQILPLDEESLQQILDYASTLPKSAAAKHLQDILGDSPQALEFISTFNSQREGQDESQTDSAPPSGVETPPRRSRKKKAPLNKLPPPRVPEDYGNTTGGYSKKEEEDYIASVPRSRKESPAANPFHLSENPAARQLPKGKPPPSASGFLVSDLPNVRVSQASPSSSKTKIHVAGGPSMHGASTTIQDLDSAIRALEIQTDPSRSASPADRRCDCLATRHPLLAAAPNCLNCGKIICVKEGIGPCTFCSHPLLSSEDVTTMIRALREERGIEKSALNSAAHRRPEVSQTPRPFAKPATNSTRESNTSGPSTAETTLNLARQHRDNLLAFQRENARRTHIIDEAADFETPTSGLSMWSSPVERAEQLKRQQKVLREQEWNAQPEYEKRQVVMSIDLVGGKVVKRMAQVERPKDRVEPESSIKDESDTFHAAANGDQSNGVFSNNPLLGALIRPVWKPRDKDDGGGRGETAASSHSHEHGHGHDHDAEQKAKKNTWRRVQDDKDDNEAWILNGGVYGGRENDWVLAKEEPACG